jgi:L-aspartate oxidase
MKKYSPQEELAPRDVVTRAIYEEMSEQGAEYMLLDLAHNYQGEKPIRERFSRIYETCLSGGIDITREPIPIVPAAHYFCGGVRVDVDGQTSLGRLYAVGEVSCTGLHGANRLASTSLLEGLLWGKRAAERIARARNPVDPGRLERIPDWKTPLGGERFESALIWQDWKMIKMTMWNHAGIVRTRKGLERAQADLNYHAHRITKFYREAALDRDIIELRNGVVTAQIVVDAAIHNERSVGCHYRKD